MSEMANLESLVIEFVSSDGRKAATVTQILQTLPLTRPEDAVELFQIHRGGCSGMTALQLAAQHRTLQLVMEIVKHAVEVPNLVQLFRQQDLFGRTVGSLLTERGDDVLSMVVKTLPCEKQKKVLMVQNKEGNTPVHNFCHRGNFDAVRNLLSALQPAEVFDVLKMRNLEGNTPLHLLTNLEAERFQAFTDFLPQGYLPRLINIRNGQGLTVKQLAEKWENFKLVEKLQKMVTSEQHIAARKVAQKAAKRTYKPAAKEVLKNYGKTKEIAKTNQKLAEKLRCENQQCKKLEEENKKLQHQLDEKKNELAKEKEECDRLQSDCQRTKEERRKVEQKLKEVEQALATGQRQQTFSQSQVLPEHIEALKKEKKELEFENFQLKQKLDEQDEELAKIQKKIVKLEKTADAKSKELEEIKQKEKDCREKMEEMRKKRHANKKKIVEFQQQILELEERLDEEEHTETMPEQVEQSCVPETTPTQVEHPDDDESSIHTNIDSSDDELFPADDDEDVLPKPLPSQNIEKPDNIPQLIEECLGKIKLEQANIERWRSLILESEGTITEYTNKIQKLQERPGATEQTHSDCGEDGAVASTVPQEISADDKEYELKGRNIKSELSPPADTGWTPDQKIPPLHSSEPTQELSSPSSTKPSAYRRQTTPSISRRSLKSSAYAQQIDESAVEKKAQQQMINITTHSGRDGRNSSQQTYEPSQHVPHQASGSVSSTPAYQGDPHGRRQPQLTPHLAQPSSASPDNPPTIKGQTTPPAREGSLGALISPQEIHQSIDDKKTQVPTANIKKSVSPSGGDQRGRWKPPVAPRPARRSVQPSSALPDNPPTITGQTTPAREGSLGASIGLQQIHESSIDDKKVQQPKRNIKKSVGPSGGDPLQVSTDINQNGEPEVDVMKRASIFGATHSGRDGRNSSQQTYELSPQQASGSVISTPAYQEERGASVDLQHISGSPKKLTTRDQNFKKDLGVTAAKRGIEEEDNS